jgi:hypothetical protein
MVTLYTCTRYNVITGFVHDTYLSIIHFCPNLKQIRKIYFWKISEAQGTLLDVEIEKCTVISDALY